MTVDKIEAGVIHDNFGNKKTFSFRQNGDMNYH